VIRTLARRKPSKKRPRLDEGKEEEDELKPMTER
jgi:hypothetical protein